MTTLKIELIRFDVKRKQIFKFDGGRHRKLYMTFFFLFIPGSRTESDQKKVLPLLASFRIVSHMITLLSSLVISLSETFGLGQDGDVAPLLSFTFRAVSFWCQAILDRYSIYRLDSIRFFPFPLESKCLRSNSYIQAAGMHESFANHGGDISFALSTVVDCLWNPSQTRQHSKPSRIKGMQHPHPPSLPHLKPSLVFGSYPNHAVGRRKLRMPWGIFDTYVVHYNRDARHDSADWFGFHVY